MIAYAPEGYFSDLACSCPVGHLQKKLRASFALLLLDALSLYTF
jgi:hypothetical protein